MNLPRTTPTITDIDALLKFLPILGADDFQIYAEDTDPIPTEEGIIQIGYAKYTDAVLDFFHAARDKAWNDSDYVQKNADEVLSDPKKIAEASLQDIKTLLTFCVRAERFCEGSFGDRIKRGDAQAILTRLAILRKTVE